MATETCIYCGHAVPADLASAADANDDGGWRERAAHHHDDCDWVRTRAHRADSYADAVLTDPADQVISMLDGTQADRARVLGVSQQTVQQWASGGQSMTRLARHMVLATLGLHLCEVDGNWRWRWR